MKNFLAIALIGLFGLTANAEVSFWQLTSEEHYSANDNESFMHLLIQFPQHFQNLDSTTVTSATLHLYNYKFVGPTICAPDDPKLNTQTYYKTVCFGGTACMGSTSSLPYPIDPCL